MTGIILYNSSHRPQSLIVLNILNIPQYGEFISFLKELTTVKAQASHCGVVSRETQHKLFTVILEKMPL